MSRTATVLIAALAAVASCSDDSHGVRQLDRDAVSVMQGAKLRTDTIGDGDFKETATFVLVDASLAPVGSVANEPGAYVTLGGTLTDGSGATVATLKPQSMWIPTGGVATFALVDDARQPRPTASAARITVRGAVSGEPPLPQLDGTREVEDNGKILVQTTLRNPVAKEGKFVVIAAFHDHHGQLMTRPYSVVTLPGEGSRWLQFVGPEGSSHGSLMIGDVVY